MTKRAALIISLALVLVFATSAIAYAYTCSWAYGNFTSVSTKYATHKDHHGTSRTFLYNNSGLVVKYKLGGTWYTASDPDQFVRTYYNSYDNDSVSYHQAYTSKVVDQINFSD